MSPYDLTDLGPIIPHLLLQRRDLGGTNWLGIGFGVVEETLEM